MNIYDDYSSRAFGELGQLASESHIKKQHDLYVFITGRGDGKPLGVAFVGTVCHTTKTHSVSINRYGIPGQEKNKVLYTAEVKLYFVCDINSSL